MPFLDGVAWLHQGPFALLSKNSGSINRAEPETEFFWFVVAD
jgi:hypothetical protein